jgi:hypothetical protein
MIAPIGRTDRLPNIPRSGDEVAIDQLAVFGELPVVLARYMDRAQSTIRNLTWVLTVLTGLLVLEAVARFVKLH